VKVLKFVLYVFGRLAIDSLLNKPKFHTWKVYENIRLEPKVPEFITEKKFPLVKPEKFQTKMVKNYTHIISREA